MYFRKIKPDRERRRRLQEEEKKRIEQKRVEERKRFEEEQAKKGLVNFIDRYKKEHWETPSEIEELKRKEAEEIKQESLLYQIIEAIQEYTPSREFHDENSYKLELNGWLKSKFKSSNIEVQRGSSRPDIVIGDIAIELKGPTGTNELQTIADKCMRYIEHYDHLLIVLFEVNAYDRRYSEWEIGMKKTFPGVEIIKKS